MVPMQRPLEESAAVTTPLRLIRSGTAAAELALLRVAVDRLCRLDPAEPNVVACRNQILAETHAICAATARCEARGASREEIRDCLAPLLESCAASPLAVRLQTWPRGYAGDFETIDYLLRRTNRAPEGTLAHAIEHYALTSPIAQQHRNKVDWQAANIRDAIRSSNRSAQAREPRVLVIACGASPDVESLLPELREARFHLVLNDIDQDALAVSQRRLEPIAPSITAVPGNVFRCLPRLARLGPFDLIVAGGLFDYLPDRQAQTLLGVASRRLLHPDGRFLFTNIASGNPFRPWIEYWADWRLIERSEADIFALAQAAGLVGEKVSMSRDGTGLTVLVEARAAGR